jgi:hypothetical protein
MRTAPLVAVAGAALLFLASCSSKDDNGGASKVPAGVVTSPAGPASSDDSTTPASADSSAATGSSAVTDSSAASGSAPTDTPVTPTSLPRDPAAAIQAVYGLGGGTLSGQEATCVVGSTGPGIVDPLNEALSAGVLDPATGKSLLKAFAACEPAAYVDQTTSSIVAQSGATKDQAACVLHAVDKLFVADDAVLTQAAGNAATAEWPAGEHDRFSAAVKTCVPDDLAAKIVDA